MTLLRFTGFELGVDASYWSNGLAGGSASVPPETPGAGRTGAKAWRLSTSGHIWDLTAAEEDDGMLSGFGWWPGSTVTSWAIDFEGDLGAVRHVRVFFGSGGFGRFQIFRGATLIFTSDPNLYDADEWHWWDVKAKVADAGGFVEVRRDLAVVGRFDGDTRNAGADALVDQVVYTLGADESYIDDVYVANEAGVAPWNDYLGDCRAHAALVNGAGFYTQLVPTGSVNNWENVDENPPSAADYNGDVTVGDKDTYLLQDLAVATGLIRGVNLHTFAGKSDAGAKSGRRVVRRAGVDSFGADLVLPTPLGSHFSEIMQQDPTSVTDWSVANFNATEVGFEVRT